MKLKSTIAVGALWLLCAAGLFAADITGKWTAEVPGRQGATATTTFNFKQAGTALTGTVAAPGRGGDVMEQEIKEGKVEGDKVTFATVFETPNGEFRFNYEGTVSGTEIKFTRARAGGGGGGRGGPQEFVAKKAN